MIEIITNDSLHCIVEDMPIILRIKTTASFNTGLGCFYIMTNLILNYLKEENYESNN